MDPVLELILGHVLEIVASVVIAAVGVAATVLTAKLAENKRLKNTAAAIDILRDATQTAVLKLQQTTVEWMKAASEDGKLSDEEQRWLKDELVRTTLATMTDPILKMLYGAGVDVQEAITNAGEAYIKKMKD